MQGAMSSLAKYNLEICVWHYSCARLEFVHTGRLCGCRSVSLEGSRLVHGPVTVPAGLAIGSRSSGYKLRLYLSQSVCNLHVKFLALVYSSVGAPSCCDGAPFPGYTSN